MTKQFEDPNHADNVIIICHSFTLRIFLMKWYNLTIKQFESLKRPKNCDKYIFELSDKGQYELTTPFVNKKGELLI